MPDDLEDFVLASVISIHKDQPIETTADSFHYVNYGVIPYRKAGQWMELLEKTRPGNVRQHDAGLFQAMAI